jgi:hypothetical protein
MGKLLLLLIVFCAGVWIGTRFPHQSAKAEKDLRVKAGEIAEAARVVKGEVQAEFKKKAQQ